MAEEEQKLTKKQLKALEFKNKKNKSSETPKKVEKPVVEEEAVAIIEENTETLVKKKRKTRRGKKGKGSGSSGSRFLLFVGNLPFNVQEAELKEFFKNCKPDVIRIRSDKGIAFLEFNGEELRSRMDLGLSKHHAIFQNRKINVELTVGGGGNSKNRLEKIKDKNEKLDEERKERLKEKLKEKRVKDEKKKKSDASKESAGIHPSRLALLNK